MRKICIINQKGGVGKTTTALNLSAGLSRADRRVLLVDLDPQSNIELSITLENSRTVYDFFFEGVIVSECINSIGKNLDLIKGDKDLVIAEQEYSDFQSKVLEKLNTIEGYDYVLFDCGPSMSLLNKSVLLYSKEAIIPTSTDYLGFESLVSMVEFIQDFSRKESDISLSKIVPTIFDRRNKICHTIIEKMNNEYYQYVSSPIGINSKLKEAPMNKKSIFSYAPSSTGAKDYLALVKSVLNDEDKYAEIEKHIEVAKIKAEAGE